MPRRVSASSSTAAPSSTRSTVDDSPSPGGSDETSQHMDRKKATHLRCERQRREAINSGYQDLKELLPPSMLALGCKTTNAAILFRACDYMTQLNDGLTATQNEIKQLEAQVSALQLIAEQYESMAADQPAAANTSVQAQMLQVLLDDCFASFSQHVNTSDYATITRSLLTWIETLENMEPTANAMVSLPFKR